MRRYLLEGAAKLSLGELYKSAGRGPNVRQHRVDIFLRKWETGESFTLMDGSSIVLKTNKKNMKMLRQWKDLRDEVREININNQVVPDEKGDKITTLNKEISKVGFFQDIDGNKYKLTDFMKDPSFGGTGAKQEAGIKHESIAIVEINERVKEIRKEYGIDSVPLFFPKVKNTDFIYVTKVESTGNKNPLKPPTWCAGDIKRRNQPKSDFHFVDESGHPAVWISYKQGSASGLELDDAKVFQQYGSAGCFKEEPEVMAFVQDVIDEMLDRYGDSIVNKRNEMQYPIGAPSFFRKIKDKKIKNRASYGVDFPGPFGHDNVNFICSGKIWIELIQDDDGYPIFQLHAQHVHENGEALKGVWEPVLFLRRAAGDSVRGDDKKGVTILKDARIFIQPIARFKELSKRATKTERI